MQHSTTSRKLKANFAWSLIEPYSGNLIIDVGADKQFLKSFTADKKIDYISVGLEKDHDIKINLDNSQLMLPLRSSSATCVVCLDVPEHIEHIYSLFSELCRISSQSVIISLPNPYRSVFNLVAHGPYSSSVNLKFYNLPADKPPEDRHRWFYSPAEAKLFVKMQAQINDFHSTLLFEEGNSCYGKLPLKHQALKFIDSVLFGRRLTNLGFMSGRMWFLLTRNKTK